MTFAQEIEEEALPEEIISVVIGDMGWSDYNEKNHPTIPSEIKRTVLSWVQARPFLDYDYYDGYGAPDCHCIYAWTESWVIFVSTYDGSTTVTKIPRNPTPVNPGMPGGG